MTLPFSRAELERTCAPLAAQRYTSQEQDVHAFDVMVAERHLRSGANLLDWAGPVG